MTFNEYRQLRVYSWYDGIYLSVLWAASFACLIGITAWQSLSMAWMGLAAATPFFVAYRLRKYREEALQGRISFRRALGYCLRVFFNAATLFAIIQWAYMQFLDKGHLGTMLHMMLQNPESTEILKQAGTTAEELTTTFAGMSPLQFAFAYLIENVIIGAALSFPIALTGRRMNAVRTQDDHRDEA